MPRPPVVRGRQRVVTHAPWLLALVLFSCRSGGGAPSVPPRPGNPAEGARTLSAPLGFDRFPAPSGATQALPASTGDRERLRKALDARLAGDAATPRRRELADDGADLRRRLRETRVQGLVIEDEPSLTRAVAALSRSSDLPLVVAPAAERAASDAGARFELRLQHPVSVVAALELLREQAGPGVRWTGRHDVVLFTTAADDARSAVLRTYDLRALTFGRTDFLAPRIDRLRLLDELEDDDGGGPFGGVGERAVGSEPEEVADLVQELVAPGTWAEVGVSIETSGGFLFVRHRPDVQRQVEHLLALLGA